MGSSFRAGRVRRPALIPVLAFAAALAAAPRAAVSQAAPLILTGENLRPEDVVDVARRARPVAIAGAALARVERSQALLLAAAKQGRAVYGLNRGVGQNKDKQIFKGDALEESARRASIEFNKQLLRAHSAGVPPFASDEVVRAAMTIRLNSILSGHSGCSASVANMYALFLNRHIHPIVPSRGSIGQADITILAHVGLAMMGEGEVMHRGKRSTAADALKAENLPALEPFAKDALTILSSNAFAAARAVFLIDDLQHLQVAADLVLAASLEGLDGNVAPWAAAVTDLRPFKFHGRSEARLKAYLEGSYLWKDDDARKLQDPLSFRTAPQVHDALERAAAELYDDLVIQINSSDDNPAVILDAVVEPGYERYAVDSGKVRGMVVPTANFEPLSWCLKVEGIRLVLSHVSRNSVQRTIRLSEPEMTGLPRFLAPDPSMIVFGAIQKVPSALDTEVRFLANPVSSDYSIVAGNIEDHATNAVAAVDLAARQVEDLSYIFAVELMHASQAVGLRERRAKIALGRVTGAPSA